MRFTSCMKTAYFLPSSNVKENDVRNACCSGFLEVVMFQWFKCWSTGKE